VGAHGGWLMPLLQFFHVGELPVVFIFSILILAMWVISLATNRLLGNTSGLVALVLFIPILFVGLVITKSLIMPFAPYISKIFSQKGDTVKVVGRTCTITSMQATPEYGSAEVTTEGAPLQLNVRTREGVTLSKGDEAVVCERDKENGTYLVAKLDLNAPSANSEE